MEEVLRQAKTLITEEVERAGCRVLRILLFGSRARGEARPESDWDFFVVIEEDLEFHARENLASQICFALARKGIFADVFVQSEQCVREREKNPGFLTYYVLQEGIPV